MKPRDAANLTMAVGVAFFVYGAMGYFSGGLSSADTNRLIIGIAALLGGAIWRQRT